MTARQPKPRPVVRVVIEVYPKTLPATEDDWVCFVYAAKDAAAHMGNKALDYRRPRVVSVKRVRSK